MSLYGYDCLSVMLNFGIWGFNLGRVEFSGGLWRLFNIWKSLFENCWIMLLFICSKFLKTVCDVRTGSLSST